MAALSNHRHITATLFVLSALVYGLNGQFFGFETDKNGGYDVYYTSYRQTENVQARTFRPTSVKESTRPKGQSRTETESIEIDKKNREKTQNDETIKLNIDNNPFLQNYIKSKKASTSILQTHSTPPTASVNEISTKRTPNTDNRSNRESNSAKIRHSNASPKENHGFSNTNTGLNDKYDNLHPGGDPGDDIFIENQNVNSNKRIRSKYSGQTRPFNASAKENLGFSNTNTGLNDKDYTLHPGGDPGGDITIDNHSLNERFKSKVSGKTRPSNASPKENLGFSNTNTGLNEKDYALRPGGDQGGEIIINNGTFNLNKRFKSKVSGKTRPLNASPKENLGFSNANTGLNDKDDNSHPRNDPGDDIITQNHSVNSNRRIMSKMSGKTRPLSASPKENLGFSNINPGLNDKYDTFHPGGDPVDFSRIESDNVNSNKNVYTTNNPIDYYNFHTNRPTEPVYVLPIDIRNREPITNKPAPAQHETSPIYFPEVDSPELTVGVDEQDLSDSQKQRAIRYIQSKCDEYKSMSVSQIAAIPLLPEPSTASVVNVSKCGPLSVPLIVGGVPVTIEHFPHMAALGWKNVQGGGYSWKCGGSLISERHVITAAHCTYEERDNTVEQGTPRVVLLGTSVLDGRLGTIVDVRRAIRHPRYKPPVSYHDIALLQLKAAVTFSDKIRPACVGGATYSGDKIVATGWGRTESGYQSQELRGVTLPVWDNIECARALGITRRLPQGPRADVQMCAGALEGGRDTCQGDSGGPAMTIQPGSCLINIVGITSVGRGCGAPKTPALYAIPNQVWIAQVIRQY